MNDRCADRFEVQRSRSSMTRFLLFLLFFVMLMADTLGLNLSLAPGISVKNAFLYTIFLLIAIETALARNRRLELLPVIIPYALFILYAIFSWLVVILIVQYPNYSAINSLIVLKGGLGDHILVLLVFFYGILTVRDALWIFKAIVWTVLAVNLVSIIDFLNVPNLDIVFERDDGRFRGPIGEPNQYAAYLVLFLPAAAALVVLERGAKRLLALFGAMITAVALIMTASRGGVVGLLGGSVLALFYLRKFVSGRTVFVATAGSALFIALAAAFLYSAGVGDATLGRIVGQSTAGNVFDASSGRTLLWTDAINEMLAHPWTLMAGFGWEAYREIGNFRMAPHNTFLKIYFELGIIGLALALIAFWNVLSQARKGLQQSAGEPFAILFAFVFGLLGLLVAIFFVDIYSPWLFTWAFIGIAMRLAILQGQESDSEVADSAVLDARGAQLPRPS